MQITKSDFLVFLDEPMHFWASIHDAQTNREFGEFQQHLAAQGQYTEKLARQYLIQVVLPQYENAELIWQPTYRNDAFHARLDALIHHKNSDTYDICEIKASTKPDDYLHDMAFQRFVCEANFKVNKSFIVHLNKAYQRSGNLDISQLFVTADMEEQINSVRDEMLHNMKEARRVAALPDTSSLASCTKPKDCPCVHLCHPNLPEYPIYDLPGIRRNRIDTLRKNGILSIKDILADFKLSTAQQSVANTVKRGVPSINVDAIKTELKQIQHPIAFLDYEAVVTSVPASDGYHPNENVAFQYSLHVIEEQGSRIQHFEFLADGQSDPGYAVAQHLAGPMPDSGTIIAWNKTYEAGINKGFARRYPECSAFAKNINRRLYDLGEIFRKRLYCHPDFHGSWSIKYILPVLVPDMSYENLEVAHGGQAVAGWNRLMSGELMPTENEKLRSDMLAYCEQDTLAMVKIWEVLRQL